VPPPRRPADPPLQPDLPAQLEPAGSCALAHDAAYAEVELVDIALTDQRARGVSVASARLTDVDLSGSRVDHLNLVDAALARCNLANLQARAGEFRRVTVAASRLTGIGLTDAVLCDVAITGCRVDLASFAGARLTRVTFDDCVLAQTDLLDARLESVRFHGCDLRRADFRGAQLHRCEFRRSDIAGLEGVECLRGAAMELAEIVALADVWAAALGIAVLDADQFDGRDR
jgi:uncharacterized protein YjbI with pentapeptide repeats